MNMIVYPPCKSCGCTHGMGIEDMETGNIEPVDLCNYCLFRGCAFDGEPIFSRNEKKEKQIEEYQRSLKNEITSAE